MPSSVSTGSTQCRALVHGTHTCLNYVRVGADQASQLMQPISAVKDFLEQARPEQQAQFRSIDLIRLRSTTQKTVSIRVTDYDPFHTSREVPDTTTGQLSFPRKPLWLALTACPNISSTLEDSTNVQKPLVCSVVVPCVQSPSFIPTNPEQHNGHTLQATGSCLCFQAALSYWCSSKVSFRW